MEFNYDLIPAGFYDQIFDAPNGMRKFWHWHKFDSVLRTITITKSKMSLLDIGCFSGSFAGRFLPPERFNTIGVDILPRQIEYANAHYGKPGREFRLYHDFREGPKVLKGQHFDVVTFIEVLEHLHRDNIREFFEMVDLVTDEGSQVIITTPNYTSAWPVLEFILNHVSDVKYEEQHITKFHYWNIIPKLQSIYPELLHKYVVSVLTSSHLVTPYISLVNYSLAQNISRAFRPSGWISPLGSILILKLEKRR